jgi:hypothetical protein
MLVTRKPLVIHDAGDEVTMARLCESLWPGEQVTKLRQATENEYRARGWIDPEKHRQKERQP